MSLLFILQMRRRTIKANKLRGIPKAVTYGGEQLNDSCGSYLTAVRGTWWIIFAGPISIMLHHSDKHRRGYTLTAKFQWPKGNFNYVSFTNKPHWIQTKRLSNGKATLVVEPRPEGSRMLMRQKRSQKMEKPRLPVISRSRKDRLVMPFCTLCISIPILFD